MTIAEKIQQMTTLAEQVAVASGFSLVDLRVLQQGKRRTVEVTIHRPGGRVSLDDCEAVSRKLDEVLEGQSQPVLDGPFVLEVQSPGIDRQLKSDREFGVFAGQKVEVKAKAPIEGLGDTFEGTLVGLDQGMVTFKHAVSRVAPKKRAAKPVQPPPLPTEEFTVELSRLISVRLQAQPVPAHPAIDLDSQAVVFDLDGTDN